MVSLCGPWVRGLPNGAAAFLSMAPGFSSRPPCANLTAVPLMVARVSAPTLEVTPLGLCKVKRLTSPAGPCLGENREGGTHVSGVVGDKPRGRRSPSPSSCVVQPRCSLLSAALQHQHLLSQCCRSAGERGHPPVPRLESWSP